MSDATFRELARDAIKAEGEALKTLEKTMRALNRRAAGAALVRARNQHGA